MNLTGYDERMLYDYTVCYSKGFSTHTLGQCLARSAAKTSESVHNSKGLFGIENILKTTSPDATTDCITLKQGMWV